MSRQRFTYRAVDSSGRRFSETLSAATRAEALRRAARDGATVLELSETPSDSRTSRPRVSGDEATLALRQLAVMLRSGVELLEALEIVAASLPGRPIAEALRAAAAALRKGDRLAHALQTNAPFYPNYVYALVRAGEASGRLPRVLEEAARHMAFERRVGRDIQNALVYPAFLVVSGAASVAFLLYVVVPRFAEMLRNARADLSGLSALVINAGVAFHEHALAFVLGLALIAAAIFALISTPEGKRFFSTLAHATPGLRTLLLTRQRTAWSKVMALSLGAGVDVLEATGLASGALPEGKLKQDALAAIPALRAGRPVDQAFLKSNALSVVDASLVRAGQRSGALDEMFRAVAERNEEDMRDALKRFTLVLEPIAIATVAGLIGAIVLALVSALVGIYENIG